MDSPDLRASLRAVWRRVGGRLDRQTLGLFVAADLAFVVLHVLYTRLWPQVPLLSITLDNGYPETYQYIKNFWVVLLLAGPARRGRHALGWVWSALFTYILLDDMLRLHEQFGIMMTERVRVFGALGDAVGHASGELVLFLALGLLIAALLLALLKAGRVRWQEVDTDLALLFGTLVLFGVVVDLLHSLLMPLNLRGMLAIDLLEDGGEMVAMSLLASYLVSRARDSAFSATGR